jgi:hypothetical protein
MRVFCSTTFQSQPRLQLNLLVKVAIFMLRTSHHSIFIYYYSLYRVVDFPLWTEGSNTSILPQAINLSDHQQRVASK